MVELKIKKRLLYKCIPDNNQYPAFLIPYEIKHGFSKLIENKYVLFKFSEWENNDKHPHGISTEVLGDVISITEIYPNAVKISVHISNVAMIFTLNCRNIQYIKSNFYNLFTRSTTTYASFFSFSKNM